MNQDDRDFKIVRSVVYTCRLLGDRPSAAKVIAAIRAINGRGMRKADVCAHMKRLFAEEQLSGNLLGTIPEQTGTAPEPILSTTGTIPEQTGTAPEHHARIVNQKLENKYTNPQSANALSPPNGDGRVRPEVDPVEFPEEDERRVKQLVVFVAAENKTGVISAGRLLSLRAEMFAERERFGAERWRYGVDEANSRGRPWSYAKAVMRNNPDPPAAQATNPVRAGPNGRRPGYSDAPPPPEKMAIYAQLGRKKPEDALCEQPRVLDRIDAAQISPT